MKPSIIVSALVVAAFLVMAATEQWRKPQLAAGEWVIVIKNHPPCDAVHNLEVNFPKDGDGPIRIECNQMEVR